MKIVKTCRKRIIDQRGCKKIKSTNRDDYSFELSEISPYSFFFFFRNPWSKNSYNSFYIIFVLNLLTYCQDCVLFNIFLPTACKILFLTEMPSHFSRSYHWVWAFFSGLHICLMTYRHFFLFHFTPFLPKMILSLDVLLTCTIILAKGQYFAGLYFFLGFKRYLYLFSFPLLPNFTQIHCVWKFSLL